MTTDEKIKRAQRYFREKKKLQKKAEERARRNKKNKNYEDEN